MSFHHRHPKPLYPQMRKPPVQTGFGGCTALPVSSSEDTGALADDGESSYSDGAEKTIKLYYLEELKVVTRFPLVNLRKNHYRKRKGAAAAAERPLSSSSRAEADGAPPPPPPPPASADEGLLLLRRRMGSLPRRPLGLPRSRATNPRAGPLSRRPAGSSCTPGGGHPRRPHGPGRE
ncbi:hypothetical protein FQA47_009618 [Oryzias melastigma]|uniref:Uncharacterized protein n=1 Tax=Oryzias melastigma TaxID=30732 RepID=A0A834BXK8_ORYME|nr:hypothetical protein FQA47_009618 [Oryzias melastigma]